MDYAIVLLPLALPEPLIYRVDPEWQSKVQKGIRVEVPFGKRKRYSGLIIGFADQPPANFNIKSIIQPLDDAPIISEKQLEMWEWLSEYYACTLGEVMNAALPAALKLASQSVVVLEQHDPIDADTLTDEEYLVYEALQYQKELRIKDVEDILDKKNVLPLLHRLVDQGVISLKEEMQDQFVEKKEKIVRFCHPYSPESPELRKAFELTEKSEHQTNLLLLLIQEARKRDWVPWLQLKHKAKVEINVLKALEKKEIVQVEERTKSRLPSYGTMGTARGELTPAQREVFQAINTDERNIHLIKGVTGSGKTRVYIEWIRQLIEKGKQVLYLVPEIGLTAQLTERLKTVFGDQLVVYHSRLNTQERVEVWRAVLKGKQLILTARSGILLPFRDLGGIVVDEEHDRSFKQFERAPLYNARDTAIKWSYTYDIPVILGSATPSFDIYFRAQKGQYHLCKLDERYGGVAMPALELIDVKAAAQKRQLKGAFTEPLLREMKTVVENGEQIILFQNRRGYVPIITCNTCGWHAMCRNCDISLTYHKKEHKLKCHYCGYSDNVHPHCPDCGNPGLTEKGLGTQKIEEELNEYLPGLTTERLDWDTAKGKQNFQRIIEKFESGKTDVLIGTQMISKGFDFDNVGLVGIVDADQLLFFPHFRANETAFQTLTQVSGRTGRREKKGKVLVQIARVNHPVIQKFLDSDYEGMFQKEISDRKDWNYPPFTKLTHLEIKHQHHDRAQAAAAAIYQFAKDRLRAQIKEPAQGSIPRIANKFIYQLQVKCHPNLAIMRETKSILREAIARLQKAKGFSTVRVSIDVDPI